MKKFTVQPGGITGKLVNPFEQPIARHEITDWDKFEQHHPPLPILTETPMKEGDVIEGDVVWQYLAYDIYEGTPMQQLPTDTWITFDNKYSLLNDTRQAIKPVKELPANNSQVEQYIKLKIAIEGDYVSKLYIAQIIKTGLGRLSQFENILIVDEYIGDKEPKDTDSYIIIKQPNANKEAEAERQRIVSIVENRASRAFVSSDYSEKYVYTALTSILTKIKSN